MNRLALVSTLALFAPLVSTYSSTPEENREFALRSLIAERGPVSRVSQPVPPNPPNPNAPSPTNPFGLNASLCDRNVGGQAGDNFVTCQPSTAFLAITGAEDYSIRYQNGLNGSDAIETRGERICQFFGYRLFAGATYPEASLVNGVASGILGAFEADGSYSRVPYPVYVGPKGRGIPRWITSISCVR